MLTNQGRLLVFECGIDLRVAASVKRPHLEGDRATFSIALSRLIPLVELADLVVDRRRGIGAGRHCSVEHTLCVLISIATSTGTEVNRLGA